MNSIPNCYQRFQITHFLFNLILLFDSLYIFHFHIYFIPRQQTADLTVYISTFYNYFKVQVYNDDDNYHIDNLISRLQII